MNEEEVKRIKARIKYLRRDNKDLREERNIRLRMYRTNLIEINNLKELLK